MPKENEIPEIVGSKDLRETFNEGKWVRGGLFINNVEIPAINANGITGLLAAINAASDRTFVDASIDDGYHLVLEARSPSPINIRAGAPYQEPPPAAGNTDSTAQAVAAAIRETKKDGDDKPKNSILDDLGLQATDQQQAAAAPAVNHPPAGMTAEQRHKARHERAVAAGAIRGFTPMVDRMGNAPERHTLDNRTEDERFNPVPSQRRIPGAGAPNRPV